MRLVYYWQQDCTPCDEKKPEAHAIARDTGLGLVLREVGVTAPEMDTAHKVRSTPTLVLVDHNDVRLAAWSGNLIKRSSVMSTVKRLTMIEEEEV